MPGRIPYTLSAGMSDFEKPIRDSNSEQIASGTESSAPESSDPEAAEFGWQQVFEQALPGLRAFLHHRLAPADIDDCLQVVSVTMLEKGDGVAPAARRAWLYRVAANESARIWRRRASTTRVLEKYAEDETDQNLPESDLTRNETNRKVIDAVEKLPEDWQRVVRLRIHENRTFQQISDELGIPLGTALTRMRRALERLRQLLESEKS